MNQFDVFQTFGKKIVGMFKVNSDKTELLLDDGSRLIFEATSVYQGGLVVDYKEAL